ncbi:hypothetical protein VNI00_011278 [Paramarasmius palmivorus]|uniref:F-box domain-containing protein n=1 Tax=Paramarasmius palmivorus TaxID=297713 RepID=A0AAW0CEG2_9AGAR
MESAMDQETDIHTVSATVICDKCHYTFTPHHKYLPDINEILRSQRPPSATEASQTQSLLEQEEIEIQRYDEELRQLRSIVDKLENQRRLLCQQAEQRRSWLAPIRRLPTEILEYILYLTHCQAKDRSLRISHESIDTPVHDLSQVCLYWRRIVLARPAWWERISLDIYGLKRNILPLLELHFKNSRGSLLWIHIKDGQYWKWVYGPDAHMPDRYAMHIGTHGLDAFAMVMRQAGRMRRLTFSVPWEIFTCLSSHRMLPPEDVTFTSLQYFCCKDYIRGRVPWFSQAITASAPMLTAAVLGKSGRMLDPIPFGQGLPFSQLHSLTIQRVTSIPQLVEHVFPQCTQLSNLTLDSVGVQDSFHQIPTVELSNVRNLSLSYSKPDDYTLFLERVRLPALQTVVVTPVKRGFNSNIPVEWPSEAFVDMLRISEVDLKVLTIQFPNSVLSDVDRVVELLKICRGLRRLSIRLKDTVKTLMDISQRLVDTGHRWPATMTFTISLADRVEGGENLVQLLKQVRHGSNDSNTF